jgi:hypothetical protein
MELTVLQVRQVLTGKMVILGLVFRQVDQQVRY